MLIFNNLIIFIYQYSFRGVEMILSDYISSSYEEYLALKRRKVKNFKHDVGMLNIIKTYEISSMDIALIKEVVAEIFLLKLKKDRKIMDATVNRYRSMLSAIFNYAIREELIIRNPMKNIKKYNEEARDIVLTTDEINRLLYNCKSSKNKELYYIVLLALYTGMRYSEIIFMEKSRLNGNIYSLKAEETKSKKSRKVVIHSECMKLLLEFMELYPNSTNRVFKTVYIMRSFATALKKSGIEGVRFHDLRRTFATTLMENGVPATIIQNQLGHSTLRMTEVYLSGSVEKRVEEIEKLCYS